VAQPAGKPAEHEGPRPYRQRATAPAPDPTSGGPKKNQCTQSPKLAMALAAQLDGVLTGAVNDGHARTVDDRRHQLGCVRVALLDLLLAHLEIVDVVDSEVANSPCRAHGRSFNCGHHIDVLHGFSCLARHGHPADAPYEVTHLGSSFLVLVVEWMWRGRPGWSPASGPVRVLVFFPGPTHGTRAGSAASWPDAVSHDAVRNERVRAVGEAQEGASWMTSLVGLRTAVPQPSW
jgi:hypothetical protein